MTFAVGDRGGGVNPSGSGDADMAGKRKLVKLAKACLPRPRAGQPFGPATTVTLAIQVAAQIGG